ncbi:hypothetical protein [Mesoplasma lactucae]|uniref:Uncharacterized protein n=1 Tax=Mesoplasma lactucae ATCC 49193 TaxID=81460 RepID=A0A291IRR2_9MOLU|nr:hypothetical protein [Mesoplasma lactucae]ATG97428.1 hypothetical protein CP520_01475 [Mesoplasma lactucae ATCC 49193]ATZ20119.1 hypothetical protein MLACT_v1c02980 [Mesoplasma lactucae ATCC 49193]MCL8216867.1 hypothetical protein [Mesoplasma lactucae ATCC 49193]
MPKNVEQEITKALDNLNQVATTLSQYEEVWPYRYLIDKDDASQTVIEVVSTNQDLTSAKNNTYAINKNDETDKQWFLETIIAQTNLYNTVLTNLKNANVYGLENKKYVIKDKHEFKKQKLSLQTEIVAIDLFDLLSAFKNTDLQGMVQPKAKENKPAIKAKLQQEIKTISDAIYRINFFELSPSYSIKNNNDDQNKPNDMVFEAMVKLDDVIIFDGSVNYETTNLQTLYDTLVKFSQTTRIILNTLKYYQNVVAISHPNLYTSKLFAKKQSLTTAGSEVNRAIDLTTYIKKVYNLK